LPGIPQSGRYEIVTLFDSEETTGEPPVAVAVHVPVTSPLWLWIENEPPDTASVFVTLELPDFVHVIVIGDTEPVYVPEQVDLLFEPSSVHPVSVIELVTAVVVADPAAPWADNQFAPIAALIVNV
jgi:hypothetical protein